MLIITFMASIFSEVCRFRSLFRSSSEFVSCSLSCSSIMSLSTSDSLSLLTAMSRSATEVFWQIFSFSIADTACFAELAGVSKKASAALSASAYRALTTSPFFIILAAIFSSSSFKKSGRTFSSAIVSGAMS